MIFLLAIGAANRPLHGTKNLSVASSLVVGVRVLPVGGASATPLAGEFAHSLSAATTA
jgi:hypothetical protein